MLSMAKDEKHNPLPMFVHSSIMSPKISEAVITRVRLIAVRAGAEIFRWPMEVFVFEFGIFTEKDFCYVKLM